MIDLLDVLRAGRCDVASVQGWRTRAAPGTWTPCGIMVHHTAGTKSLNIIINGRSDLPGPLANLHIDKAGRVNLVSGGRANHAGPGAAQVLMDVRRNIAPSDDAVARRLVDGPTGNAYFYGIEAENLGDGIDPWPPVQLEAIAGACAALCRHHGWSTNRIVGHREWTRRKPDPRGVSMRSLRARVYALVTHQHPKDDDDMAFNDKDSAHLEAAKNYSALIGEHQNPRIIELLGAIHESQLAILAKLSE